MTRGGRICSFNSFRSSRLAARLLRRRWMSKVEGEALLTRFPIIETGNLDYQARDIVALVARVVIEERPVDFYVTHLYMSRGDDSLRLFQVQQLLQWIDSRADGTPSIVCGDFNATPDASSAGLMATRFRPTQTMPTAFSPLADRNGAVSHPYWPRMDRCIDYIWISDGIEILASEVCCNRPSPISPLPCRSSGTTATLPKSRNGARAANSTICCCRTPKAPWTRRPARSDCHGSIASSCFIPGVTAGGNR